MSGGHPKTSSAACLKKLQLGGGGQCAAQHTAPMLAPMITVDAAETQGGYRISLSTRSGKARAPVFRLRNQQQAELKGVSHAAHFVSNQKVHSANLLIDNVAAL